jgi:hypothetical protein
VTSIAQSIRFYDVDNTRAAELSLKFEVVFSPVHTVSLFRATYSSEHLSLKDNKLNLLPFGQLPCLGRADDEFATVCY